VESNSASAGASPAAGLAGAAVRMCESPRCSQFLQAVFPAARQVALPQPPASGTLSHSWPFTGLRTSRGLIPQTGEGGKGRCSPKGKKKKRELETHPVA